MNSLEYTLGQENIAADLIALISVIVATTCTIAEQVSHGALGDTLGATSTENIQGEVQKKLDVIANNLLVDALRAQNSVRALASEEEVQSVVVTPGAPYIVAFDPLDGSSNIDINAQIGTIFTIFNARNDVPDQSNEQFFQQGSKQLCAGYVLYGPYTTLVITTGKGVHEYTLNQQTGEFISSKPTMMLNEGVRELSANMANLFYWSPAIQRHITALIAPTTSAQRFNMRWQGAMVGDVHKILTRGGIFIYPSDSRDPKQPAKLRLLYEAFPMALLLEAAGGAAYSESGRMLTAELTSLHQRTAVILGDKKLVNDFLGALSSD